MKQLSLLVPLQIYSINKKYKKYIKKNLKVPIGVKFYLTQRYAQVTERAISLQ